MKHSQYILMAVVALTLGVSACGKKKSTTASNFSDQSSDTNNRVDTSASGDARSGGSVVNSNSNSDPNLSPSCFNYVDNFTLSSLDNFFYPNYNSNNPPIPHANGDLAICFEYDDTSSVVGHIRVEYHYTPTSQPGTLKVVRFTTKLFRDIHGSVLTSDSAMNARLYNASVTPSSLQLIWMDNVGFMGLTANLVAGSNYNGRINFVNMPGDSDVDDGVGNLTLANVANPADEEKCLNGQWTTDTCVSTRVFGKSFYEKGRDGSQSTTRAARVVAMVRKLLDNSHPSTFVNFEIKTMLLGNSIDIDLDDARNTVISE